MNGSSATRFPSTTIASNVNDGEPTTWIVSGVTEEGSTLSLNWKISGWFNGTPAMFGRLKLTSTRFPAPSRPAPPQETAETPSAATAAADRSRGIRLRIV